MNEHKEGILTNDLEKMKKLMKLIINHKNIHSKIEYKMIYKIIKKTNSWNYYLNEHERNIFMSILNNYI